MMVKKGINSTRAEKQGPTVKQGIDSKGHKKTVRCPNCKSVLEKCCSNELVCEISIMTCPKCGNKVS